MSNYIINPGIVANWDSDWGYGSKKTEWWEDYHKPKEKKKHDWEATLLVFSTVYTCKHCGAKKEKCDSEYCSGGEEPPDFGGGL